MTSSKLAYMRPHEILSQKTTKPGHCGEGFACHGNTWEAGVEANLGYLHKKGSLNYRVTNKAK